MHTELFMRQKML